VPVSPTISTDDSFAEILFASSMDCIILGQLVTMSSNTYIPLLLPEMLPRADFDEEGTEFQHCTTFFIESSSLYVAIAPSILPSMIRGNEL